MNQEFSFGGIPSPIDYRDIHIANVAGEPEDITYPMEWFVDITSLPVWHQRKIGACVGHATTKYKQKLDLNDTGKVKKLSARFVYALCKEQDGYPFEGTYPRLSMKILQEVGCATEATCPNDTKLSHADYIKGITKEARKEAVQAKIKGYAFVDITPQGIRQAVYEGDGISMLVRLGREWYTDKKGKSSWDKKDLLPIRPPKQVVSGHQIYVYGYEVVGDDMKIHFLNSWSKDWCDEGKGWFWWSEYKDFINEGITAMDIPDHLIEEAHNLPPEFAHTFSTSLDYGQRSEEVKNLQRALKVLGYFKVAVTGYYGDITADALLKFQQKEVSLSWYEKNVLKGKKFGPKSIGALNKALKDINS